MIQFLIKKTFNTLKERTLKEYNNDYSKISNVHMELKDLYLLPIINISNPPIRDGSFTFKNGSIIEDNKINHDIKTDMVIPGGGAPGLEWYAGLKELLPIVGGLGAIFAAVFIKSKALVFKGAAWLIKGVIKLFKKDPAVATFKEEKIKELLDKGVANEKNKFNIGIADIESESDLLDLQLNIDSYARANATAFFGNRTTANLLKVVGIYKNPVIRFDQITFNYKDF